ncbi:MAG: TetR family transcriptional regulator [Acidimicrobiia bacterium]|nr:TetR family transcriptional regulator [Acidimicrobiia bacterium]MCY4457342.1 TetR family transcriptional regulator [Acidimicrobiaceae bacterium]
MSEPNLETRLPRSEVQEQILDAVAEVILRQGISGASMRTVAKEAEVSLGLLSYHFDDKQTLIMAVFQRATDRLFEACAQAASEQRNPVNKFRAFLRGAFTEEFLTGSYLALRIALWALALTEEDVEKLDAAFYDRYAARFRELLSAARPDLPPAVVVDRVQDLIASSNGLWLNWARWRDNAALERGLSHCEALALDGAVSDIAAH